MTRAKLKIGKLKIENGASRPEAFSIFNFQFSISAIQTTEVMR